MGQVFSSRDSLSKEEYKNSKSEIMASWKQTSTEDTDEYRKGYPKKKDDKTLDANARFYMNKTVSKPSGALIEEILQKWRGDYRLLESHHGYIQWLFPIREDGLNRDAQELQLHEIKKICGNKKAHDRVLRAYKMMLDFYGMKLMDEKSGKIERAENSKDRFQHLNQSPHNCLRITRILKSLGELGYEHLKKPFIEFILHEAMLECTLSNLLRSCSSYWIDLLKNDDERQTVWKYFGFLSEMQTQNISDEEHEGSKKEKKQDESKSEHKTEHKKVSVK